MNDSLVSNSINIAESAEPYLYSYAKIRSLLKYNSQINTIYLGFSYEDLSRESEQRWLFNDENVIYRIKKYNHLLENPEKLLIIKKNPMPYLKGFLNSGPRNFSVCLKSYISKGSYEKISNFGGYLFLDRNKLQEAIKRYEESKSDSINVIPAPLEKALIQEKYLKMISQLCHRRSVNLVLFNAPKHKYYITNLNEEIKNYWHSVQNSLPRDSVLDLSTLAFPDSCYGDLDHLNYKGAKIFSRYLNERLHPY